MIFSGKSDAERRAPGRRRQLAEDAAADQRAERHLRTKPKS